MKAIILLLVIAALAYASEIRFADGQMMRKHHNQFNPSNEKIKVFLIPHSHDDVGWLKTVDDYYYGGDQSTQRAGVQYTIDTVVTELAEDPAHKFSIVEVAFLYRWWNNANETMKNLMYQHIANGQLEFLNAGWCMSDEATPYYEDIIDQMTIGLRWIKKTFDFVPRIGWHIDPFGHQASNAALFNQLGFNAWFFVRIDYQDKDIRLNKKAMQMIWHPTQYSGIDNSIFTHVNYYHYSPPPGYNFDTNSQAEPIKDDPTLEGYNIDAKSTNLVNYFKSMALHYRSNNLLHTLGEDFHYANARMWYKNFDKLIKYVNARPEYGLEMNYATPSEYIKAIHDQKNTYPTKYDDFFPYADNPNAYWTGYFISRISLKGFVRELGRLTQAVRTHIGLLKLGGSSSYVNGHVDQIQSGIWELQMAMGILQHHDAVAGTAKQKVTNDYIITGSRALAKFNNVYRNIQREVINTEIGQTPSEIFSVTWNATATEWGISKVLSSNKSVLVNLYNPGSKGTYTIRLKTDERQLRIVGTNNVSINGDLICSNLKDTIDCELFFNLAFQQTSYNYVKLIPVASGGSVNIIKLKAITILQTSVTLNLTSTASLKITRASHKFDLTLGKDVQEFLIDYNYYESYQGDGQKSGAYIFRASNATINAPKKYTTFKGYHYAEGSVVSVVVIEGDNTVGKLYLSKTPKYIETYGFELETYIDSISISDRVGKEIVLTLATKLANNKTFYTDSNGLEEQKRIWNYRPQWPLVNVQGRSGNYYPINSHISLIDTATKGRLTVLVDRSEGGTSGVDGEIQIMIHRRTTMDDARGVGEALNETQSDGQGLRQLVRHYIVFGDNYRTVQKWNDQRIVITWTNTASTTFAKKSLIKPAFPVPENVKLYLRPYTDDTYLLRFHNFDTKYSNEVSIPSGWQVTEYTLGANQLLSEWQQARYTWKEQPYSMDQQTHEIPKKATKPHIRIYESLEDGTISLKPFEIRTFILSRSQ